MSVTGLITGTDLVKQLKGNLKTDRLCLCDDMLSDNAENVLSAVVSGGCAETVLLQAAEAGADLVLTGEFKHQLYHLARELGMNVIAAGHYATETVGVKAVMEKVSSVFGIETEFADCPTGL